MAILWIQSQINLTLYNENITEGYKKNLAIAILSGHKYDNDPSILLFTSGFIGIVNSEVLKNFKIMI